MINFIAKVMEDSGFKVYKNFKTSQKVIDIYAIMPTTIGDFDVVVACKNYDKEVNMGSPEQKGDWMPLLFIMTDGHPSDIALYNKIVPEVKKKKFLRSMYEIRW